MGFPRQALLILCSVSTTSFAPIKMASAAVLSARLEALMPQDFAVTTNIVDKVAGKTFKTSAIIALIKETMQDYQKSMESSSEEQLIELHSSICKALFPLKTLAKLKSKKYI